MLMNRQSCLIVQDPARLAEGSARALNAGSWAIHERRIPRWGGVAAAGTMSDAVRTLDRLEPAGLDVAVVRDDPAVDPKETLRLAHATMRARGN